MCLCVSSVPFERTTEQLIAELLRVCLCRGCQVFADAAAAMLLAADGPSAAPRL